MPTFEEICQRAEAFAVDVGAAAARLQRASRAMKRAAADGNPSKVKQAIEQSHQAANEIGRLDSTIDQAWPLTDDDMKARLDGDYAGEVVGAAQALGIKLSKLEDRLAAFPVIVQILPKQGVIQIDAARLKTLRPSVVARRIEAHIKKSHIRPERFIELLYKSYQIIRGDRDGVRLLEVYDALTLLPDSREAYSRAEFARDIYLLHASETVRATSGGARVEFPSATGTRDARNTLTVVPPDGMPRYYYGLRFVGDD